MKSASLEEVKAIMIEPNLIIDLKGPSFDVHVMKGLGLFFLDLHVFIRIVP